VAATDYRCLDFDGAVLYPTTEWTQAETTGSMSTDSTAYTSAPQSLRFTAEADQSATLATNLVGATAVKSLSISADFNWSGNVGVAPPWATTARLMCLGVGNSRNCLTYSHGASGGEYAIEVMGACAAAFMTTCPVAAAPTAGVWTRITMTATTNGALQLTFNGVSVVTGCSAALCTGATGLASLGYYQAESSGYSFSYDNVQVTAQR